MSRKLASEWLCSNIRFLQAALHAEDLFDEAEANGVDATIIAAPELTENGRCCLARWMRDEMMVLHLSPEHQRSLGVQPGSLYRELGPPGPRCALPNANCLSLSRIKIDRADRYDGRSSMSGHCNFEFDDPASKPISSCALQVQYFRPDLPRQVTGYWYPNSPLVPPKGTLHFSYDPLFSETNPGNITGTMVVFLQLLTGRDWTSLKGCQRVSNIAASVIELV